MTTVRQDVEANFRQDAEAIFRKDVEGNERMTEFKVGDRVTVHASQKGPQTIATVKAFTRDNRCMVLSDGSEWRADGKRQWGFRGSFYKGPVVAHTVEGDADFVHKRRAIGAIRKFADGLGMEHPITAPALQRILDAIAAETAALEQATGEQTTGEQATGEQTTGEAPAGG